MCDPMTCQTLSSKQNVVENRVLFFPNKLQMSSNATQLSFDTTPAASVSLACCQSLCDLLKELPLPTPTANSSSCLSSRLNPNVCQNFALINSQLEAALSVAKQQLADLVFNDTNDTSQTPNAAAMSPLAMQMSMKGLFFGHNNNWNESNSLETIEPSLRLDSFDDSLKLIDDCLQNDCNDTDVKYFNNSGVSESNEDSYSSLGERVKSRQRQHNPTPVAVVEPTTNSTTHRPRSEEVVVQTNNTNNVNAVNNSCVEDKPQRQERQERHERQERQPKASKERKSHSTYKNSNHSTNNHNISHDFQNKDSLVSFEMIVNKLMSDCVDDRNDSNSDDDEDDDRKNDMSFDLRIDLKELNLLMSLSSKLKHSNKTKDLENRLSSKLTSFLSLLTNKMIVWFSKFKETEEYLNQSSDDTYPQSSDDNVFWQLLINASKMSLNLMTSKGMSSRVVLFEELLEIIINFLSHNLNSKTHISAKTSPSKKSSKASSVLLTTSATKRQVTHWTELMELLAEYLSQNKCLNDSIILMITRIAMSALLLNSCELQAVAVQLLSHVFKQYAKHRNSILEELLNSFHRIPVKSGKSSSERTQNVFTRLLIALTNALFDQNVKLNREALTKALTDCLTIISAFLSSLMKRCLSSTTSSENDLKTTFDVLLNDLLLCLYFPNSISSLLLIQILTKLLITNLSPNSKSALTIRLNSIEFLANIASKFAKLLAKKQEILEESQKTLNQLSDDKHDRDDTLVKVLRLLNHFFNSEKLYSEKAILSALWIKEKPIVDIEQKFFAILNSKDDDRDDDSIDATTAHLFIKCLELNDFSTVCRLFDASLSHVTSSLSLTTNTTQRSRAMKSLSQILVNCTLDKSIQLLARSDLQRAMRSALLDPSTSVREATVDLIGRFVLQSKSLSLVQKYCDLIGERILDTGVSVRKRVIRILRDVCVEFPEFPKCGEIQLRIIKRVNDEGDGIRKLVLETVRDLWFKSLLEETTATTVKYKVMSLLHVIGVMLQTEGTIDSLQTLFEQIVDKESVASQRIVDFVVGTVLVDNNDNDDIRAKAINNLSAVHLLSIFAHIQPELLVKHVDPLQSLLSLPCDTIVDIHLRNKLIQSLERILPKLSNPSQQLMNRLEEDLTKQILQSSAHVLPNCVKCLSVLIEKHTHNTRLSSDLFSKFRSILVNQSSNQPKLLRAIYSLGLFLKHFKFDFHSKEVVLETILALIDSHLLHKESHDLICRCITSLGFIIESDPKICLQSKVIALYSRLFSSDSNPRDQLPEQFCLEALSNFRNYLSASITDDETTAKAIEWSRESLKQMTSEECDSNSIQSQVIQTYLALLLDKALSASAPIRRVACNVVHVIQSGGHVHPLQLVPHLIAMTTDDDPNIRSRADHVLHEIERKFHGFVAMKARAGIQLAIILCRRLKVRGFRLLDDSGDVTSRLATLYHVICTNRQSRRGFVQQLLRSFEVNSSDDNFDDDDREDGCQTTVETTECDTTQLMFEMVLFFPFTVFDEILFILQQLECIQSVNSTQTSQLFSELFGFQTEEEMDDKFDDSDDNFTKEIVEERAEVILCKSQLIRRTFNSLRKVFLVSFLRKLLKEFYLIKDEKILEYSPNEAKVWEKPIHRRHVILFVCLEWFSSNVFFFQIETSNLSECLLKANPSAELKSPEVKIECLLEEFRRFKSVSLTSTDPLISNQWIQQKVFTIQKQQKSPEKTTLSETVSMETTSGVNSMDDLNETERKRLLESIRRTSCHVSLVDIGIDPNLLKKSSSEVVSNSAQSSPQKKRSREEEKKKMKKKRKRMRIESESESSSTTSDDSDDDFH